MPNTPLNLDDLVRASGFTKRQIRFYITRKLIPGAGENRGPNAVYPPETRRRLRLISELKQRRRPPTGRRLTLEEIRHELDRTEVDAVVDAVAEAPARKEPINWGGQLSDHLMKSSRAPVEPDESPQTIREDNELTTRSTSAMFPKGEPDFMDSAIQEEQDLYGWRSDLRQLLERLNGVLDEMSGAIMRPAPGDGNWLHLSTDDLKIQVRWPECGESRASIEGHAHALRQLLKREVTE